MRCRCGQLSLSMPIVTPGTNSVRAASASIASLACRSTQVMRRTWPKQRVSRSRLERRREAREHAARVALEDLRAIRRAQLLVAVDVALRVVEVVPRLWIDAAHGADH